MFRKCTKLYSLNNNYKNGSTMNQDLLENNCSNINSTEDTFLDDCACGFNNYSVFPTNPMLAQSYVPIQYLDKSFKPCIGLKMGTIFPELVSPYVPCQNMEQQQYISKTNVIGKGCNKIC